MARHQRWDKDCSGHHAGDCVLTESRAFALKANVFNYMALQEEASHTEACVSQVPGSQGATCENVLNTFCQARLMGEPVGRDKEPAGTLTHQCQLCSGSSSSNRTEKLH